MTQGNLSSLKDAAEAAVSSESREEKIEALARAFKLFSEESQRLEAAHAKLTQDYQNINHQLEEANERLNYRLRDLNITASYLKNILGKMSQGLLFINRAGFVTTYNPSAEKILHKPAIDVLFHKLEDVLADDFFGFSVAKVLEEQKSPVPTLIHFKSDAGEEIELEVDARFVNSENEEYHQALDETLDYTRGVIILLKDVTAMRHFKLLAERNDRLKELGEMAAMVAHEIRNPLGGIKGFASLLERDLKDRPELQKMAHYIVDGTESLNTLVTQVLNYARPIQPSFKQMQLEDLLQEVRRKTLIDPALAELADIRLEVQKPVTAMVDASLLQSALLNLIVNAIQAMPEGGIVGLWLDQEGDRAILRVSDTGSGIEEGDLEKIFSPFFTTKPEGNGFGLTEVHKVIQAHGGTIHVDSTEGKGTTFTIRLPISQRTTESEET